MFGNKYKNLQDHVLKQDKLVWEALKVQEEQIVLLEDQVEKLTKMIKDIAKEMLTR